MNISRKLLLGFVSALTLVAACGDADDTAAPGGGSAPTAADSTTVASSPTAGTSEATQGGNTPVTSSGSCATGTGSEGDIASGEPVLIGAAIDQSGPLAPYGNDMLLGIGLAVEQFNQSGGLDGQPVELVTEDLASDRAVIAGAIRKLSEGGVAAVLGPASSTALVVGAPVAEQEGVVLLPPASQEAFGDDVLNEWVFRIAPVTRDALPDVLDQMQEAAPFSKLAIFYDPANNASVDDANLLQEYADDAGFEIVAAETAEEGATDFSSQISNIASSGADAIWLSHLVEENAGFMIQARERGIDVQFLGGTTFTNPEIFEIAGEAGEGAITYVPFLASASRPETAAFVEAFSDFADTNPNSFNAYGYDAMCGVLQGLKEAGTADRQAIRDAMASLSFGGATSTVTWDGAGDNQTPEVVLVRVNGEGGFEPVG